MTTLFAILKGLKIAMAFLKRYWKSITVAVVAGGIIAGGATLWGRLYVAQGQVMKLQAEVELLETREQLWLKALDRCIAANKEWEEIWQSMEEMSDEFSRRELEFKAKYEAELERRRAAQGQLADLQQEITAESCEGAVDELIQALDWGGEDRVITSRKKKDDGYDRAGAWTDLNRDGVVEHRVPLVSVGSVAVGSFIHQCCDCALVHRLTFQSSEDAFGFPEMLFRWTRLEPETKMARIRKWGPRWNRSQSPLNEWTPQNR
jgi:hypothetical protein